MARLGFNANDVAPDAGGGCLPAGEYEFQVIEEELGGNSKGTGEILKLTFEVLSGEFQGRKMWVTINVTNTSPVAQEIGQGQLSALCHATGQMQVDDTEELLWKPFRARTKVTKTDQGKDRAEVQKYLFGDALDAPVSKAPPSRPSAPATANRPAPGPVGRPAAAVGGGRSLPWQGRDAGRPAEHASRPGPALRAGYDLDDDIPF